MKIEEKIVAVLGSIFFIIMIIVGINQHQINTKLNHVAEKYCAEQHQKLYAVDYTNKEFQCIKDGIVSNKLAFLSTEYSMVKE